jgi:hypothetical protein
MSRGYITCLAVKAASLQSPEAPHLYIPALRKAAMVDIATTLSLAFADFSYLRSNHITQDRLA